MAIRYKVVTLERKSMISLNTDIGKYLRTYEKGKKVKAVRGSLGIMTFKQRQQAEKFIDGPFRCKFRVLRVKTTIRGKRPKFISRFWRLSRSDQLAALRRCYRLKFTQQTESPPKGTLCYSSVEVID